MPSRRTIAMITSLLTLLAVGAFVWMLWDTYHFDGSLQGLGYIASAGFFLVIVMPLAVAAALATTNPGASAAFHMWTAIWMALILVQQMDHAHAGWLVIVLMALIYLLLAAEALRRTRIAAPE